jgi:carboxyl-terminal processing protease
MKNIFVILYCLLLTAQVSAKSSAFSAGKNIDLYFSALKGLDLFYVDTIDFDGMVQNAVDEMLQSLDPYTVRISEDAASDFDISTTGEYGGVGMIIRQRTGAVEAVELYEGAPAQKAGIQVGDRILQIDTILMQGKNITDISNSLKGKINTSVMVKLLKYTTKDTINLNITRAKIHIPAVPYYGLMPNTQVGYIAFSTFTSNCSSDVKKALLNLKERGAASVILDLRNNTGGLMDEAVNIVELFVPKGQNVVSMKGRTGKAKYLQTKRMPTDTDIPLAVLVNGMSASSSEIVAGALQDLDRAVIIGQKSFGKGLVQTVLPLPFNQRMKLTTARYYTPSGRCVQAINYANKRRERDTSHRIFRTANGRPVYDAGGITPDIALPRAKYSILLQSLMEKNVIHDFASQYHAAHSDKIDARTFVLTDADYEDFIAYAKTSGFSYQTVEEQRFSEFEKTLSARKDSLFPKNLLTDIKNVLQTQKSDELRLLRAEIQPYVEQEIVSRYAYQWGRIENSLRSDKELEAALKLLQDKEKYAAQLTLKP